jgi:hypothetical protein
MQGNPSHIQQGWRIGSIIGVSAARRKRSGAWMIDPVGQACRQASHLVQPARKSSSSTAPGGRKTGKDFKDRADGASGEAR